jgi:uncharacterized protein YbcI
MRASTSLPLRKARSPGAAVTTTTDEEQSRGGSLSAAISNAVVRRTAEYTGRGPTKARTTIRDDTILVVLQDTLTKGERALVAHDRAAKVLELRSEFQGAMRQDITADIERLTGREVIAFMSTNHIDPDLACELFVLKSGIAEPAGDTSPNGVPATAEEAH